MDTIEVVIKQPNHADRVVRLSEGATRMGRAEDNEIVLSDGGVSRRHAQVYVARGEVTVEDLGSGNGTYYNGYRIQSQPVHDGDEIVIDPFVLQFKIRGAAAAGAARADNRGSAAPARLQVVMGSGMAGSSYPITSRGLSIGRSEDRDVVIADPAASRHHCQISVQGGEYVLRDMGSANGVFVNAVRVRECTLADGDLVRIGNTEMRFVRYDAPADGARSDYHPGAARQQSQAEPWHEPHGRMPSQDLHSAPPPRRRSSRPIFALLFGGLIVFLGFMVVVLFLAVLGVFAFRSGAFGTQVPQFPPQPPRWSLNLPTGLEAAPVDVLFEQGQQKMSNRAHREALQDFYRVLAADPGYPYVDKFAFAAGEFLVLDTLEQELISRAADRAKQETKRDQLLVDYREGPRAVSRRAERELKHKFADDPKVIAEFKLGTPNSVLASEKLAKEGAELMAAGRFDEASRQFSDVLDRSKDPAVRADTLAKLRMSQKEVARASADLWSRAVMTEATGDRTGSKSLFLQLREEHSYNPSVDFHLARLP